MSKKILLHKNFSFDMILQKVNFFRFLKTSFGVQALHLEEKVRIGAYAHFENKWGSPKSII